MNGAVQVIGDLCTAGSFRQSISITSHDYQSANNLRLIIKKKKSITPPVVVVVVVVCRRFPEVRALLTPGIDW